MFAGRCDRRISSHFLNSEKMKYGRCIALCLCGLLAQFVAQAQQDMINDPTEVSFRREPAGTRIMSYDSRDLALQEDDAHSLYIRSLNGKWQMKTFHGPVELDSTLTEPGMDVSAWQTVTVPEREANDAWAAVYRREFTMPFKWIDRQIFVRLDAVSRAYYVFANGHPVGYHEDSKTPAYFDITRYVADGKNTIAVIAYAHPASEALENQIETEGTQIEGAVRVIAQPKVRIRDFVIDTRFNDAGNALFSFGAIVKSHLLNPKEVLVHYELIAPDDSTVVSHGKRDARFYLRSEDTVRFFANLPDIQSWSHESPKLYTIALRLQHEGRFTEYTKVKIGFRKVEYDDKGFRINGYPVTLHAVDYDCPKEEATIRRDFENFRKQGINCLRITDYPQNDRFYELTDSYGLYVCNSANIDTRASGDERTVGGTLANDTVWTNAYVDRVTNMYYMSKNHPSVLMFSLGDKAGQGYNTYEAYLKLKEVEKERPVIYQEAGAEWNSDMVVGKPQERNDSDGRFTLNFAGQAETSGGTSSGYGNTSIEEGPVAGRVKIVNGFGIANMRNFEIGYTIIAGAKRIVKEGVCSPANIPAGESALVDIPLEGVKPGKYTLVVYIAHRDEPDIALNGTRIVERSLPLVVPKKP